MHSAVWGWEKVLKQHSHGNVIHMEIGEAKAEIHDMHPVARAEAAAKEVCSDWENAD